MTEPALDQAVRCRECGAPFLTAEEIAAGRICTPCLRRTEPPPCTCGGVAFVRGGFHVRTRMERLPSGREVEIEYTRTERTADGGLRLERCPKQEFWYAQRRERRLAAKRENER